MTISDNFGTFDPLKNKCRQNWGKYDFNSYSQCVNHTADIFAIKANYNLIIFHISIFSDPLHPKVMLGRHRVNGPATASAHID